MRRVLSALAALTLLPAAAASAQSELTAVLGYRSGDGAFTVEADALDIACLVPPCFVAEARTPESEALGLVLDVPIAGGWLFEALLNRQSADLRLAAGLPLEAARLAPESFELTTLQVGAQRRWGGGAVTPFVAAGVGVARVESSAAVLTPPIDFGEVGTRLGAREVLSLGLGGGARQPLGPRWALRYELRAYWTDLPQELGGALLQIELGLGLAIRLR